MQPQLQRKQTKRVIDNLKQKNQLFRQTVVEGYDPLLIPGDTNKAYLHREASKVGREAQINQIGIEENLQMCPCCGKFVQKDMLSIKQDILQLSFLGSGYPMYFEFLKFCMILQGVLFFLNGIYGIITNAAFGTACISQEEINTLPSYIKFRLKQRKIDIDCDENDVQANDYTILCSNIPKKIDYKGDPKDFDYAEILKDYFQKNLLPEEDVEIFQVGLCFNCDEIIEHSVKLDNYIIGKDVTNLNNKILELQVKKRQMQSMYCEKLSQEFIEKHFTGYAYVIFQREQDKEKVIQYYQQNSFLDQIFLQQKNNIFKYEGEEILIQQAPDPNNINWKNLKFSKEEKLLRRVFSFILTVIILGTCLSIILGLNFAQNTVEDDSKHKEQSVGISLISIAISVCITILNPILRKIIVFLAKNQGLSTRTHVFISIAIRTALAQFLTSSILLILTQVLIVKSGNIYGKIFGRGNNLIDKRRSHFFDLLFQIERWFGFKYQYCLFDLVDYYKWDEINQLRFSQKFIDHQIFEKIFRETKFDNSIVVEQYPEFDIEVEYASSLETVYSVLFYAPVFPLVLVWGIVTIFFRIWINKYNLMHRSTVKFYPSLQLCLQITESLEYCLPLYSLSNMLAFIYISDGEVDHISVFGFIVGVIHAILPMQILNEKVFKIRERVPNECTYEEVRDYFNIDYDRENPVKKDICIEYHIFRVKSQVSNIQNSKKEFLKNIQTYQTTKLDKQTDASPKKSPSNLERQDSESLILKNQITPNNNLNILDIKDYIKASSNDNNSTINIPRNNQQIIQESKKNEDVEQQGDKIDLKINLEDLTGKKDQFNQKNLVHQESNNFYNTPQYTQKEAEIIQMLENQSQINQNSNKAQSKLQSECDQEGDRLKNESKDDNLNSQDHFSRATIEQEFKLKQNKNTKKKPKHHLNFTKSKKQYKYLNQVTLGQFTNDDYGFCSPSQKDQSPAQNYNQSETDYLNVIDINKDDTPLKKDDEESQTKLCRNGSENSKNQKDEVFTEKIIQDSINGVINLNFDEEETSTNGVNSVQ